MSLPVLLINANRMRPPIGPIGLDYVADALVDAGHEVDLLDLSFTLDTSRATGDYFHSHRPRLIGISLRNTDDCYFASQESFLGQYRRLVSQLRSHSDAPIVLGGAGFSIMPEAILKRCGGDLGVAGDGEAAIVEIAGAIESGDRWDSVPGVVYRRGNDYVRNPTRPVALEGRRRRRLIDNARYLSEGGMGNIETKRGCAQKCTYCADPLSKGRQYRLRPPKDVVDEIATLLAQGIDVLHFCDAEFNLPRSHAEAVCREIADRGLGDRVSWYTYAAAQPFDDRLAGLMLRAGCKGINFGVDSGSDAVLSRLRRSYSAAGVCATAEACHRQGLNFMFDLLIGGPGETTGTLRETIELMKRLAPARVGAAVGVRVYPGTELERDVRAAGFQTGNPEIHGAVEGNEDCAEPVFFVSSALGGHAIDLLRDLVAGDERFFVGAKKEELDKNYNYNDNSILVDAIRRGERGAYWDILRRVAGGRMNDRRQTGD